MKTIRSAALLTSLAASLLSGTAFAQKTTDMGAGGGGSAHVKTEWAVANANISIAYGRPALKGRSETKMMPVFAETDSVWRTGADVATIITTDKTLKFGTITLAPGSYTINTKPGETSWSFVAGRLSGPKQWGVPYQPALEIGRAPMKLGKTAAPVELLTITIDPAGAGGTLNVEWGSKKVSIPFTVVP
ncbi:MAG: DUF2911 domain-containing protein [Gemmatimonadaceae bacterium]